MMNDRLTITRYTTMTTELMCAFCDTKIEDGTMRGMMKMDGCYKDACGRCINKQAMDDCRADFEESKAEAKANDTDYDSDDWVFEEESDDEE